MAHQSPDHTPTCTGPGCHRPVDGVYLCGGCAQRLRDDLHELAGTPGADLDLDPGPDLDEHGQRLPAPDVGLVDDLHTTMARLSVAEPDTSRPAPEPDPDDQPRRDDEPIATHRHPLHQGAANLLGELARVLRPWVAVVAWARYGDELAARHRDREYRAAGGHGPVLPPLPFRFPHGDTASIARWLALYPNVIAGQPDGGVLAGRLQRLVGRGRDLVVPRPAVYLGWCGPCWETPPAPPPGAERREHGPLIDLYADPDDTHVRCPRCGSSWPVETRRAELLTEAADLWLPAPEIERALVDFVRDAYTDHAADGSRVLADDYRPMTAAAIHGHADRGRLPVRRPTVAQLEQAAARGEVRPAPLYRVGDVMGLVRELRAERAARAARRELRGKQRRRHPTSGISARAVF